MEKEITDLLIALIRADMQGTPLADRVRERLTDDVTERLYALAEAHDLTHMVNGALCANGLSPTGEVGERFDRASNVALYRFVQMGVELERLCGALEKAEIPYMPLKGAVIRPYYPKPEARTSCDIDILLHEEDIERAVRVLTSTLQYRFEARGSHDVSLFSQDHVHVELHFELIEGNSRVSAVLSDVWSRASLDEGRDTHTCYVMDRSLFVVYHIAHMAEHFVNGGCGVRPFLDLWVAKYRMGYDVEAVRDLLERCGLRVFGEAAMRLAEVWLSDAEHTDQTAAMERYIMGAGIYGTMENKVAIAQSGSAGRVGYVLRRIFLPYAKLKQYYPTLKKYPVLFPLYQVRRWIDFAIHKDKKRALSELKCNSSVSEEKRQRLSTLCEELELL